jgi:hypothetical protein
MAISCILGLDESATSIDRTMVLSPDDVEAVARRTVELLQGEHRTTFRLVDARELAVLLGVQPSFVYAHATELGAMRLGSGRKARMRFDVDRARQALDARRRRQPNRSHRHGAAAR